MVDTFLCILNLGCLMCCKKEDFIDGFSVHSIGSPDHKFPDFLCERQRNGLHVWECPESGDLGVLPHPGFAQSHPTCMTR